MSTTVSVILDTRRMKVKSGAFPVKLQVSCNRVTKHYQTIFDLNEKDYEKLSAPRISTELQEIREALKRITRQAEDEIAKMSEFNFFDFEYHFIAESPFFKKRKRSTEQRSGDASDRFDYTPYRERFKLLFDEQNAKLGSIGSVYLAYVKLLLQEGRIGTAIAYKDSYSSIRQFSGNVLFTEITVGFLNQYEQWMMKRKRSKTTIGIKLRNLRSIFNYAIEIGLIRKEKCYPFGRRKYQIPTGRNIKKALDQSTISKLYYYQSCNLNLMKARDFWMFCYMGNGMNPKDVVHLKWKDIQGEFFVFTRAKTDRTTRNDPRPISVYINDDMWRVIDRYGNKERLPNSYVFPIMDESLDPLKQYSLVPLFTRFINDGMKEICDKLKIGRKVTTIVSRHSFSTQLKRSGVSTEFIQEALGHTDKRTTENYLDSFENEVKKEFAMKLTAFKKNDF